MLQIARLLVKPYTEAFDLHLYTIKYMRMPVNFVFDLYADLNACMVGADNF